MARRQRPDPSTPASRIAHGLTSARRCVCLQDCRLLLLMCGSSATPPALRDQRHRLVQPPTPTSRVFLVGYAGMPASEPCPRLAGTGIGSYPWQVAGADVNTRFWLRAGMESHYPRGFFPLPSLVRPYFSSAI